MKTYTFAPISAREYPTVKILDNPYIWGGVQFCVNVSEKPYTPELEAAMAAHGIEWVHCPVSEDPGADWLDSFAAALPKMYRAYKDGKKQVVHCDMGNNRSPAFVEALYFAIERKEYDDPYKGADNHLVYNCIQGHLPVIGETERRIMDMVKDTTPELVERNLSMLDKELTPDLEERIRRMQEKKLTPEEEAEVQALRERRDAYRKAHPEMMYEWSGSVLTDEEMDKLLEKKK